MAELFKKNMFTIVLSSFLESPFISVLENKLITEI